MVHIEQHLLNDIKPLRLASPVREVLDLMEELKYGHMPVLGKEEFMGLIGEDDLLEIEYEEGALSDYPHLVKPIFISHDTHIFEALKLCGRHQLSLLPVLEQGMYRGYISPLEISMELGRQITFDEPGSVIVLQMEVLDFSFSQIAQIVESEDAKITGILSFNGPGDKICVALKINQLDLSRIIKSFERYNYQMMEVYHQALFEDSDDRYLDSLFNYLNI